MLISVMTMSSYLSGPLAYRNMYICTVKMPPILLAPQRD